MTWLRHVRRFLPFQSTLDVAHRSAHPDAAAIQSGLDAGSFPLFKTLFDTPYYATQAGLAAESEQCLAHYLNYGAVAGLQPHRLFDGAAYLARYPDVASAGMDPFFHF